MNLVRGPGNDAFSRDKERGPEVFIVEARLVIVVPVLAHRKTVVASNDHKGVAEVVSSAQLLEKRLQVLVRDPD
jgi:hypothetical protein